MMCSMSKATLTDCCGRPLPDMARGWYDTSGVWHAGIPIAN